MGLVVKDKDGYRRKEDEEREIVEIKSKPKTTENISEEEDEEIESEPLTIGEKIFAIILFALALYAAIYLLQFGMNFCIKELSWLFFITCV